MDQLARKENKSEKLPQTFQSKKKNRKGSLRHCLSCLKTDRRQNGGSESIFEIKAVLWRQGQRKPGELN